MITYRQIINFWFEETDKLNWFVQNDEFDNLIKSKYAQIHQKAVKCELYHWRNDIKGRLAEIIIVDQFSRNMFRGSALSFAYDSLALALSQEAILSGESEKLTKIERNFLYMPFMHSESSKIHGLAIDLYEKNGDESSFEYEGKHKKIIDKFGRYPHRNKILNRESTKEELSFLELPDSSF